MIVELKLEKKQNKISHEWTGATLEFNIEWSPTGKTLETIKWMINKEKYDIYHGSCMHFKLHEIILHCLMVITKSTGKSVKMKTNCYSQPFLSH
jgi:hypothetical protein